MSGRSGQDVISSLQIIATMNKYRARAEVWTALGADTSGDIRCVMFNNDPWAQLKTYGPSTRVLQSR